MKWKPNRLKGVLTGTVAAFALISACVDPQAETAETAETSEQHAEAKKSEGAQLDCSLESLTAPADTTLVKAERFDDPVSYCRIDGYVTTTNPGPNQVNFMVALPDEHNERYFFTIQGGAAAFVPDPSPMHLDQGYAVASTDKGVKAAHILDFSFRNDPAMSLDWAYRGVHVAAVATQALTREYYSSDTLYRYAAGCSGGGDGTLSSAEMYPEDFDGFIGAAMTTAPLEINHFWGAIAQRLHQQPESWISPEEYEQIHTVLLEKFDGLDGAEDGLIWYANNIILERDDFDFLNDEQFGLLQFMQAGLKPEKDTFYPGFWLANVTENPRFLTGHTPPPWETFQDQPAGFIVTDTGAKAINGPDYNVLDEIDYSDRDQLIADRNLQQSKGRHAFDPARLSALKQSGGKLILWTGMAEQAVPPGNIVTYTEALDDLHGAGERESFVRTFLVPGLHHCFGGDCAPTDTPDKMLEAAAAWVEDGQAPDAVILSNPVRAAVAGERQGLAMGGEVTEAATRTYKICSFPQRARFVGGLDNPEDLDVSNAENWVCE